MSIHIQFIEFFLFIFSTHTQEGRRKTFGTFRGTILRSQLIILLKQKVKENVNIITIYYIIIILEKLHCNFSSIQVFHERGTSHTRKHRLNIKDFRDAYPRFPPIRVQQLLLINLFASLKLPVFFFKLNILCFSVLYFN